METLDESLYARVDELIQSHQGRHLLSTIGTQASIEELVLRTQGLEDAIRELALEVEKLAATHSSSAPQR